MSEQQAKIDSVMETVTNVAVGFAVAMVGNAVILPFVFGVHVSAAANVITASLYTVLSIVRQYSLRRLFNGKSVWQAMKTGWSLKWQWLNLGMWSNIACRRVVEGDFYENNAGRR